MLLSTRLAREGDYGVAQSKVALPYRPSQTMHGLASSVTAPYCLTVNDVDVVGGVRRLNRGEYIRRVRNEMPLQCSLRRQQRECVAHRSAAHSSSPLFRRLDSRRIVA